MKENSSSGESRRNSRPGMEVLLCCGRAQIDLGAAVEVRRILADNEVDWQSVVAVAKDQRMSRVLFDGMASAQPDLIPFPECQETLKEAIRESAGRALELAGELRRLYQLFEAAGFPAIPYKGPVLSVLAYGDIAKRDYTDLDFALPQRFIPQAVSTMRAAGYLEAFDRQLAHTGEKAFAPGQYAFLDSSRSILVELHTERTLRYFPTRLDFQDLECRMICVEVAGQNLRTFSVEDTLVMLCAHGAKHFWDSLGWIFDVAKLVAVQKVDWTRLEQIAAKLKCTRVVLLGLYLAHDFFGACLPDSILQRASGDPNVQQLARKVRELYAGISDPGAGVWSRALFRFQSRDGIQQGLRHILRLAVSPTESDHRIVSLPRFLGPLYMLVRPWRLLREYGLGAKRLRQP